MDGPEEPAHGHLGGQKGCGGRQREKDRGVSKDKIKHPDPVQYEEESICSADVSLKIPVRKVNGQTLKGAEEIFDLETQIQIYVIKVCCSSIPTTTHTTHTL